MGRAPYCDKNGLKKGLWTLEEDQKLVEYIRKHGCRNWRTLPKNAGLQRCGKSCRLRWTNYLRSDIKRGRFSSEEEETIIHLHSILGNKWSAIAACLPGRTDNEIKNYWKTHISKRLLREGIDHAPRLDLLNFSTVNPTKGFVSLPLDQSNFDIQRPHDVSEDERYSFERGVHKLWVYSSDKPHTPTSQTHPRTEIRIQGYDYSSGVWQFEGYGYVPSGITGVCIMQVSVASPHATTLVLRVNHGSLYCYRYRVLVESIYDRWFKLNVIHDVNASTVKIYIDGQFKMVAPGRGGPSHYFKCGVYEHDNASPYMESRWKGIKVLKIRD